MMYETADVESLISEGEPVTSQTKRYLRWALPTAMLLSVGLLGALPSVFSSANGQAVVKSPEDHQSIVAPPSEATARQQLQLDSPDLDGCYKKGMFYSDPIKIPGSARTEEANPAACQARCKATSGCTHFTFWPDGGCMLTGFGSRLKASPAKHSGTVVGPKACALQTATTPPVDWSLDVPPAVNPDVIAITVDDNFIPTVSPVTLNLTAGVNGTSCSAYPECVALNMAGNCCPNDEGVALGCCSPQIVETVIIPAGTECAAFPGCMALNLTQGACCPTGDGVRLGCCDSQ